MEYCPDGIFRHLTTARAWEDQSAAVSVLVSFVQDCNGACRQWHTVFPAPFRPLGRNRPSRILEVYFEPFREPGFCGSRCGEDQVLSPKRMGGQLLPPHGRLNRVSSSRGNSRVSTNVKGAPSVGLPIRASPQSQDVPTRKPGPPTHPRVLGRCSTAGLEDKAGHQRGRPPPAGLRSLTTVSGCLLGSRRFPSSLCSRLRCSRVSAASGLGRSAGWRGPR